VAKENHVIDWSGAKILNRESHRKTRQLRKSIHTPGGQLHEQMGEHTAYLRLMTVF